MSDIELKITKRDDLLPRCPFCEQDIKEIYTHTKGVGWIAAANTVCFCPHCRKVLGFGQSKMM